MDSTRSTRRFKFDTAARRSVLDVPIDSWYTWLGVATVSVIAFGAVTSLPTAPPPDAASVADAIDRTAASQHNSTAEIPIGADELRIGSNRIGLRNDGGTAHASLAYGPVVPVGEEQRLQAVLRGSAPSRAFDSPAELRAASEAARTDRLVWRPVEGDLLVRHLTWKGVGVTLVGQR
jgi:hypothetical protein